MSKKIEAAKLHKTIGEQYEDTSKHITEVIEEVTEQGKGFKMAKIKLCQGKPQCTGVLVVQ